MKVFAFLLLLLLGVLQPCSAQALELRSGEVVFGRVIEIGEKSLQIEVSFPVPGRRTIARLEVEPRSLYSVLAARIDQDDARAHLALAATCRELGLFAHAIAECREALRRDAQLVATVQRTIAELREAIALDLLRQAEAAFADDRLGSARLAAHAVVREHPYTAAAKDAADLLRRLDARSKGMVRRVPVEKVTAAIQAARAELGRTANDTWRPAHGSVQDQHRLERCIDRLEKVWACIGDLAPPDSALHLADSLSVTQAQVRERLVAAYLAIGLIYLQRRALPDADAWCDKACQLDPDNQQLHRLHELILHAKLSGWHQ